MRARSIVAAVSVGATVLVVGPMSQPAGAAVNATTAGTIVTVTATGNATIEFGCSGGKITVNAVAAAPSLNCSSVTQVAVNGDLANQSVYGSGLRNPVFSSLPKLTASMGDGSDYVDETLRADQIDLGPGNDAVTLYAGGLTNTSVDLGAGTGDSMNVEGTSLDDSITAASPAATATVGIGNTGGSWSISANNAENLAISGNGGNDTINTTAVVDASTVDDIRLEGGTGNDSLSDGAAASELFGGAGTNTLSGGPGRDAYWSESSTDTLDGGGDTVEEWIYDTNSLRSGGRTVSGFGANVTYVVQAHQGDVSMRVRPAAGGATLFTTSLTRPGQQVVPAPIGGISLGQTYSGALPHRGLADIVATNDAVSATLPSTGGGLIDITIPTGSFTPTLIGTNLSVSSSYGQVTAAFVGGPDNYRVHGPWTDKNEGFAHRVVRDLLFRFPSDDERTFVRNQLTNGIKTRAAVAQAYMDSDEYRGLDVDRVFLKYLRRVSDPGGRTYWINSLQNGKALWRFRAQLFGSNEYFTKAGGTNASYVAKAYADVLGRAPDPSGQTYWTNKLNNGANRGSVALQFINSPESRRRVVDDQFLRFLDRLPVPLEQQNWVDALPTVNGEQALIAALAASSDYYNRS